MALTVEEWGKKLVGKAYVGPDETAPANKTKDEIFTEEDLSTVEDHRVVGPMGPMFRDFREERLTVYLDDNKVCTKVQFN